MSPSQEQECKGEVFPNAERHVWMSGMIISRGENAGDAGGTRTDDDEQSEMQNGIAVFLHGIGIEARKDRHLRADQESLFLG